MLSIIVCDLGETFDDAKTKWIREVLLFFFSNKKIISIPNASASIDAEMRAEITLFTEVDDDVDVGDIEFDFKFFKF